MGWFDRFKEDYRNSLKSMDTEETVDLLFYRPIGYVWARLAKWLGVTPNAITIASIFLGVGAGVLMYFNDIWINLIGILLLVWANSFDSADGQLARMTGQYSKFGRILDGISGDLWFVSIYVAICLRVIDTTPLFSDYPWLIWLVAILAGGCHAKQAAVADYYRQLHLYFVKGVEGTELTTTPQIDAEYAAMPWRGNFFKKIFTFVYRHYTANQEVLTPSMQCLRRELKNRYGENVPMELRQRMRGASRPLMKYTNILTFNTRSFALFASLIAGYPEAYFVFELTLLNLLLVYMMWRHESMCKFFIKELKNTPK